MVGTVVLLAQPKKDDCGQTDGHRGLCSCPNKCVCLFVFAYGPSMDLHLSYETVLGGLKEECISICL